MKRGVSNVGAPVLLLLAACAPKVRDPLPPACRVTQSGDGSAIIFYQPYGNQNAPLGWLEVRAPNSFLWVLELKDGPPVQAVEYGVVPPGYKQNVPEPRCDKNNRCTQGPPPTRLHEGVTYEVACGDGLGRFKLVRSDLVVRGDPTPHYLVVNLGSN